MIRVALALLCAHAQLPTIELELDVDPAGGRLIRIVRRVSAEGALELRRLFDRDRSGALDAAEAEALVAHVGEAARAEAGVAAQGGQLVWRTTLEGRAEGAVLARGLLVRTEARRAPQVVVTFAPRLPATGRLPIARTGAIGAVTVWRGALVLGHALPSSLSPGEQLTLDVEVP